MYKHNAPFYKPLFDRLRVRLEYFGTINLTNILAFQGRTFGLFDCGSFVPKYWNQLFALYRYALVHGITVKAEFVNIGTAAFNACIAESNTTDSPTTNMKELMETPRTVAKQSYPGGNRSDIVLTRSASGLSLVGHSITSSNAYWTQLGVPPTVDYLPQLIVGFEPTVLAAPFSAVLTLRYYLDCEFFTLNPT